ncbi:MAG TPA: hypothetical protein PK819_12695 [Thermomicrobiales bacterium]|nr:hypothetical protein [Thermomicrobiales bacterium]
MGTVESAPVELRAYATNANNSANGGFAAGLLADKLRAPATWLDFDEQVVQLEGTQTVEIPFTISVPKGAAPGQYVAALVAESAEPQEGGQLLNFVYRSAVAVEILVPGKMDVSFAVGSPEIAAPLKYPVLTVPIENTGNYRVQPTGSITVSGTDGRVVSNAPIAMGSVYMGNATTIEVALPSQFAPGDYVVSGSLTDPDSGYTVDIKETTVTYTPASDEPVEFVISATIAAVGEPIQFAAIDLTITNAGQAIPTANIVLSVRKDGKLVEDYPIAQNQAIAQGDTSLSVRYIPITGWQSGTYTFVVTVNSVDASGTQTLVGTQEIETPLNVP